MSAEENRPAANNPAAGKEPATGSGQGRRGRRGREANMLPGRERRRSGIERVLVRLVATAGIVGIGVALGAILISSSVAGWETGLIVSVVSVVLSAILWSSRQL
jgi:protein-S-isoprenylcysteine O-methyltransferase Ste14